MGKTKKSKASTETSSSAPSTSRTASDSAPPTPPPPPPPPSTITLREWISNDPRGKWYILGSIVMATLLGFLLGTGYLEYLVLWKRSESNAVWRQDLADRLRSTKTYKFATQGGEWLTLQWWINWEEFLADFVYQDDLLLTTSPQRVFALLREAVIREKGGYVHPDLGFLEPAPSGAARGIGMVRDSYQKCQVQCLPGLAEEKLQVKQERKAAKERGENFPIPDKPVYKQEEVLIKVPLSYQMTRSVALETLLPLIPSQQHPSLHELDDAALLVLLLAHERGVGRFSPWLPYIASLPPEPSCGYSKRLRPFMLDAIAALHDEYGVDTQGWAEELFRATQYAQKITDGLAKDYGAYLERPTSSSAHENIAWALCQVASRATAGSAQHGTLRLVPVLDQINHDTNAGGFLELTGKERLENDDFIDATEDDSGTFVVRSLRHGRRKALRKGQELLANYNVPYYTPLDWFVSLGFVPPERRSPWQKIDPVLPRVRRDGPFAQEPMPTAQFWKDKESAMLESLQKSEL